MLLTLTYLSIKRAISELNVTNENLRPHPIFTKKIPTKIHFDKEFKKNVYSHKYLIEVNRSSFISSFSTLYSEDYISHHPVKPYVLPCHRAVGNKKVQRAGLLSLIWATQYVSQNSSSCHICRHPTPRALILNHL